jgi:hypothetical protein
MNSEAFSIGMWSGAGFEKVAGGRDKARAALAAMHAIRAATRLNRGRGLAPKSTVKDMTTKALNMFKRRDKVVPGASGALTQAGAEPGFFNSLTPNQIGLGLGIPAGLLGYMAGSSPATLPPPPMMNPLMMMQMQRMQGGMYGMPGGHNQMPMPPSARLPY